MKHVQALWMMDALLVQEVLLNNAWCSPDVLSANNILLTARLLLTLCPYFIAHPVFYTTSCIHSQDVGLCSQPVKTHLFPHFVRRDYSYWFLC